MEKLVWVYYIGQKYDQYFQEAILDASYSNYINNSTKNDLLSISGGVVADKHGKISVILPRYETNQIHSDVKRGSIILFYDKGEEEFIYASQVLFKGRDKDRQVVSKIWPYQSPAKTYFVCTTQPVRVSLSKQRFNELFEANPDSDPVGGGSDRQLHAPRGGRQLRFFEKVDSIAEFLQEIQIDLSPEKTKQNSAIDSDSASQKKSQSDLKKNKFTSDSLPELTEGIAVNRGRDRNYSIKKRRDDPQFRPSVRSAYNYRCAICGAGRRTPDGNPEVEAAHIYPASGFDSDDSGKGGPDIVQNGIALCKLHHWAFDNGWFAVKPDYTITVSNAPNMQGYDEFKEYHGEPIYLPDDPKKYPKKKYLQAHRLAIYE